VTAVNQIMHEIDSFLERMREDAARSGTVLRPPLLLLGTSERVGSNWLSDTLRPITGQHNEPFRQQLGSGHPLSALNPDVTNLDQAAKMLGPYGRHWLVSFVASKYATTRQAVKETNLFFAWSNLLALFPDAPITVLTRSPLGVVSSFARGDLYRRWAYQSRYHQMVVTTRRTEHSRYGPLVPDDNPSSLVTLVRLQILNTILLAEALHDRQAAVFAYETALFSQDTALRSLAATLPDLSDALSAPRMEAPPDPVADDTFVTTHNKTDLIAFLDRADAELVRSTIAVTLKVARQIAMPPVIDLAARWLAGDHLYLLEPQPPKRNPPKPAPSKVESPGPVPITFVRRDGLEWRNVLVSNTEYAAFLNELSDAGLPNTHNDSYLLVCPMPHERGGRLYQSPLDDRWHVSDGFANHPVYWVTWIGAALFAAAHGSRLPTRAEMIKVTGHASLFVTNADYAYGDTTPVNQAGRDADEIHHLVGNLQVWCADGPTARELHYGPASRWLHGAAWNTPATPREIHRPRHRHLAGSSRGIGIRLVREQPMRQVPVRDLALLLHEWTAGLGGSAGSLTTLGEQLAQRITQAAASQADVALGAHVGAGAGETGLSELHEPVGEAEGWQVGELDELNPADRPGVGPRQDIPDRAARSAGFEGDVHDVGAAAGQVIAHVQQAADLDFESGLLAHLPHQCIGQRLTLLDLAAGQGPRPSGIGVLVEQKDVVVLDDDSCDPNFHLGNLSQEVAR
jgi:hypothetical protein